MLQSQIIWKFTTFHPNNRYLPHFQSADHLPAVCCPFCWISQTEQLYRFNDRTRDRQKLTEVIYRKHHLGIEKWIYHRTSEVSPCLSLTCAASWVTDLCARAGLTFTRARARGLWLAGARHVRAVARVLVRFGCTSGPCLKRVHLYVRSIYSFICAIYTKLKVFFFFTSL